MARSAAQSAAESIVDQAMGRRQAGRRDAYVDEVHRIIEATYRVVERTGSLDPTVRDILKEAGLSTQAFYRYFQSKDELFVALLEDGRRQIADYLTKRMDAFRSPDRRIRAWIEGVLAQASSTKAAQRTRPFLANLDRLAEAYPDQQRASEAAMLEPLQAAVIDGGSATPDRDARAIYLLTVAAMHDHLRHGTKPTRAEIDHLTRFSLSAMK